jgi:hypothetical protein
VLKGVLDHLPYNIIEHKAGFDLTNPVGQIKMFLHAKEELNFHIKVKNN